MDGVLQDNEREADVPAVGQRLLVAREYVPKWRQNGGKMALKWRLNGGGSKSACCS